MKTEVLMNVTPQETRIAMVENGVLQELHIERESSRSVVGNIYKGKVNRVLPGMEAAFVDIGLERAAFLHASDADTKLDEDSSIERAPRDIEQLLKQGQEVLVQVVKEPLGSKGARLTAQITLPARYLVYLPYEPGIGISARIEDESERERLKQALDSILMEFGAGLKGGFILRTVAEGVNEADLRRDFNFLLKQWAEIETQASLASVETMVYEDLHVVKRQLRDIDEESVDSVMIDSREMHQMAHKFASKLIPTLAEKITHYPGGRPIFELYGIEDEISNALKRKVILKSGGHIVIDQTEAMTTIDINTGGFVGKSNLEETIFKTNLEAAQTIARQLRVRNLGGLIIIDFIDMLDEAHKLQVTVALEAELAKDSARTRVLEVSELGLVEMTRKRTRESLEHALCVTCPTCDGRGFIKSLDTVSFQIMRELLREARQFSAKGFLVMSHPDVIDHLQGEESASLAELQDFSGISVRLQPEALYTPEQFDVVLL